MAGGAERILMDTNAIIESHRTNCFRQAAGRYRLETCETCVAETQRGKDRKGYVPVSEDELRKQVAVHALTQTERVEVALQPGFMELDPGERELVALLVLRKEPWRICTPDKAAIRLLHACGHLDGLVSLEELAKRAGSHPNPKLKENYTQRWQSEWSTKLKLGVLT